jgi:UMP-CMP kinase
MMPRCISFSEKYSTWTHFRLYTIIPFISFAIHNKTGTQCEKVTQSFQSIMHLSAGDLLRAERKKSGSKLADIINEKINKGELVPSEITVQLIQNAMHELYDSKRCCKFLIDGFPRSQQNLDAWDKVMDASKVKVDFVLYLDCPESIMTDRLLQRGKTSGRSDDTEEIIKKRFQTAQTEMMPIVESYKKDGKLKQITADQSVENVFTEVSKLFTDF